MGERDEPGEIHVPSIDRRGGRVPEEITCREVLELLSDYVEDALPPAPRAAVEAHLQDCEPCHRYLDQLRAAIAAMRELPAEEVPQDMRDALVEAFRSWRRPGG